MTHTRPPRSIVVGIDGSDAGLRAARWAVDEAVNRELPLRLVHVIEPGSEAVRLETEYAHIALRAARAAVVAVSPRVSVDTAVKRGGINAVLVRESRTAEMLCIGSASTGEPDRSTTRSLSAKLAHSAQCPVAVIGATDERAEAQAPCLAVVMTGSRAHEAMLRDALEEARLRRMPVMVVDSGPAVGVGADGDSPLARRLAQLRLSYPDVVVHSVVVQTDIGAFLAQITPAVAVTIVDGSALQHEVGLPETGSVPAGLNQGMRHQLGIASEEGQWPTRKPVTAELVSTSRAR